MLEIRTEEVKSINDRLSEAMMKIPLYTDEWTNFNPSDPGITTLESLLYYSEGQEMSAGAENEETRLALMKLTGFLPKPGKCSRVLLSTALQKKRQVLPKASKFSLGDMCFERLGEAQGKALLRNLHGALPLQQEAVGHPVVVSPELHLVAPLERHGEHIGPIRRDGILDRHPVAYFVTDRRFHRRLQFGIHPQEPLAHLQEDGTVRQERLTIPADGEEERVGHFDLHFYPAVGRVEHFRTSCLRL